MLDGPQAQAAPVCTTPATTPDDLRDQLIKVVQQATIPNNAKLYVLNVVYRRLCSPNTPPAV